MSDTEFVLHHPDLELDEAVGVEAVVLPHAAVADFVATQIQLAVRIKRPDFGVANSLFLQNVYQALMNFKVVLCDGMGTKRSIIFVGFADYSGFMVKAHLQNKQHDTHREQSDHRPDSAALVFTPSAIRVTHITRFGDEPPRLNPRGGEL